MSWARLDDHANEHRKQLAAGAEACWLWACGLMYANRQKARDGFIPEAMIPGLFPIKNHKRLAAKLVEVRLWLKVDGGYQIHDYHALNLNAEQYEAQLAAGRERAARSYASRSSKSGASSRSSSPEESGEERAKNSGSSGVEWSEVGPGSGSSGTGSTPPIADREELRRMAQLWLDDPTRAAFQHPNPEAWQDTRILAQTVAEVFGGPEQHPRNSGDPRMQVLFARWKEGRTTAELEQAIRGAGRSDHYRKNPEFQTLKTILGDSERVDKFIRNMTIAPAEQKPKGNPRVVQPGHGEDAFEGVKDRP